ncbi:MAG: sulfurtransferase [Blastocatellia bacterium]
MCNGKFLQFSIRTVVALFLMLAVAVGREVPRAESVVSPAWVKARLDAQAARSPGSRGDRLVIIEASWATAAGAKDYQAGHLPGAIHLNTDELENGYPRWALRPASELHRVIGGLGITPGSTVVVYGKQTIAAARVWWVMKYAGVADVRLLNGGFAAWTASGYPAETSVNAPTPVKFTARVREDLRATTAYVRARYRDRQTRMADARSREEHVGATSGYTYVDFKGRIPGSLHIGNVDDSERQFVNADGTLRDPRVIRAMWERAGLVDDGRETIFYCGSGWRSSLAFLYAWMLGMDRIRNYSDGWIGWSTSYRPDKGAKGGTPGWRQDRTRNPVWAGDPC